MKFGVSGQEPLIPNDLERVYAPGLAKKIGSKGREFQRKKEKENFLILKFYKFWAISRQILGRFERNLA